MRLLYCTNLTPNVLKIMAKFRVGIYNWHWPTTSIKPSVVGTSYGSPSSFFNMGSYSFFTGPNGFSISTNAVDAYNSLPYWTAYAAPF